MSRPALLLATLVSLCLVISMSTPCVSGRRVVDDDEPRFTVTLSEYRDPDFAPISKKYANRSCDDFEFVRELSTGVNGLTNGGCDELFVWNGTGGRSVGFFRISWDEDMVITELSSQPSDSTCRTSPLYQLWPLHTRIDTCASVNSFGYAKKIVRVTQIQPM
jgi:hypothetical protein